MKKLYKLFIGLMFVGTAANAQVVIETNFESWLGSSNDSVPSMWNGTTTNINRDSVMKITSGAVYGSNAVKLQNSGTSGKRFSSNPVSVTAGQTYEIKFWIKGEGEVATRMWSGAYDGGVSYVTVNSPTWTMMSGVVTAGATAANGEFIIYVRNTVASSGFIEIDSVVVSNTAPPVATPYTINQIQFTTTPPYDSPHNTEFVETSGVVTALQYNGYYLQDGNDGWNGVFVLEYDSLKMPDVGDNVTITGTVDEYFNYTTIKNVVSFNVNSTLNTLPSPTSLSTFAANDEQYEGVLIRVSAATCTADTAANGFGEWTVNDGSGALKVDDKMYVYAPTLSVDYNVTGVMDYSFSEFKLLPREMTDVEVSTNVEEINDVKVSVYPNPVQNAISFELSTSNYNVQLFDITGKTIKRAVSTRNKLVVSTSELNNGVYFYSIYNKEGSLITTNKFIVAK